MSGSRTGQLCRRLVDKVAVLTGSTDGIGLAIARRLAQEGAKVVVSSRKQQNVDRAVKDLKGEKLDVVGVVCDMSKSDDRRGLLETAERAFGGIDILVSNPAFTSYGPAFDTSEADFDKIFDVNVKSNFLLCKEVTPRMRQRGGGGAILLITSTSAYQPYANLAPYGVSKTALCGMVRALLPQLTENNIRINAIAPGWVRTKMSSLKWKDPAEEQKLKNIIPQNRLAEPAEFGGPAAFLVSDDASYVTGETLVVAGGMFAHL